MDVTTKPRRTQRIEPLSTEEMQKIIGKNWKYRLKKKGKWHGKEFNWWKVYYWAAVAGTVYGGPWGKAGALYLMFEPSEGRYYRTHCGWWY
ncbi:MULTISPECIES: hypothetical protein [Methanothermobacter]|jgi:hypothetical protein|uniref:Uncharacterized protein n=2 Tax=Methanothermobacter TaxID=145260 RepID=O26197_METTH|nr:MULTISPECIES: hypothetical protein [Methanothermobacter]MDN5373746.1 hypothetical protein [Methanothermobacter sp.]AAB84607.1 unknown [Methanothermobacter thermautotrophicus str. Delta H]UXH32218.1 hypothetical protein N5910_02715 [Methanothermobacter wolfeii]WBF06433.1 hypothetical protein ISG35_00390 [Methanothermobacter thermautotrophicus]WBF08228.1 hypothetical protein ISG36_00460 [Methanothermobacter thermautotrophicus]